MLASDIIRSSTRQLSPSSRSSTCIADIATHGRSIGDLSRASKLDNRRLLSKWVLGYVLGRMEAVQDLGDTKIRE